MRLFPFSTNIYLHLSIHLSLFGVMLIYCPFKKHCNHFGIVRGPQSKTVKEEVCFLMFLQCGLNIFFSFGMSAQSEKNTQQH